MRKKKDLYLEHFRGIRDDKERDEAECRDGIILYRTQGHVLKANQTFKAKTTAVKHELGIEPCSSGPKVCWVPLSSIKV